MEIIMAQAFHPVQHLSASSVECYLDCPRRWRYRYIEKRPDPPGSALIFGSAWHEFWQAALRDGMLAPDRFAAIWQQHVAHAEADTRWSESPEELALLGARMCEAEPVQAELQRMLSEKGTQHPQIETWKRAPLPSIPVPLLGAIDCLLPVEGMQWPFLYDFKTAARAWGDDEATKKLQARIYPRLLVETGVWPADWETYTTTFVVFTKTKNPDARRYPITVPREGIFGGLDELLADVWAGMINEVYPPNTGSWLCRPEYCSFYGTCQGHQRAQIIG